MNWSMSEELVTKEPLHKFTISLFCLIKTTIRTIKYSKMDNSALKLPIEIRQMIFSQLQFKDQLKCRQVCKDWMDMVEERLPKSVAFKPKIYLNLEYCTLSEDNVSTIVKSDLPFWTLVLGKQVLIENVPSIFPALTSFFDKLGETVTYLDISKAVGNDIHQVVVENLSSFKVLQYLNVGEFGRWLEAAWSTTVPVYYDFNWLLKSMVQDLGSPPYKAESVEKFLDSFYKINLYDTIMLRRHNDVIAKTIINNLDQLNNTKSTRDVFDKIVEQIQNAIKDTDKLVDFSTRINTSVKAISFEFKEEFTNDDVNKMLSLVPNVQEISVAAFGLADELRDLIINLNSKIVSIKIVDDDDLDRLENVNLCNLKYLQIGSNLRPMELEQEKLDHYINLFPSIKTVRAESCILPTSHFEYITELDIFQTDAFNVDVQLANLTAFKNLHSFDLRLMTREGNPCFFIHQPLTLDSVKNFSFIIETTCCTGCTESLLQSFPNLTELKVSTNGQAVTYVDKIFEKLSNLEQLEITDSSEVNSFEPKSDWIEMNRLRIMALEFFNIRGDKASWDSFGKKLNSLKYFEVKLNEIPVDLLDMIGLNMPALKKVAILDKNRKSNVTQAKTVVRNGRSFLVDEFIDESQYENDKLPLKFRRTLEIFSS